MKKSKDRFPERGNANPYNGYGYPQNGYGGYQQDGYPQNGYGGYQQDGYPQNGYQQEGYPQNNGYSNNGYGNNGYSGYGGYGGYGGYPGYGYPGYGYPGYPGYGYPGYGGYGGYGGYPQMNYIADSYPQEDYGGTDNSSTGTQAPAEENAESKTTPQQAEPAEAKQEPQKPAAPAAPATPTHQEEKREEPRAEEPKTAFHSPVSGAQKTADVAASETHRATDFGGAKTESKTEAPKSAPSFGKTEAPKSTPSFSGTTSSKTATGNTTTGNTATLSADAEEYKRKWYTVTAEYENYRKRTQSTKTEAYQEGRADVVKKLFPIGDNLDRAMKSCQDETTKKGIAMVLTAFEKLLDSEHITVINPVGMPFDPNECEAIMAMDALPGQESGIVTEVYVKGYAQNDKVLRYAQVIVTK